MKQVISSQKLPIKMWLDDMEQGAIDQAKNLADLPFAFKHIAIMPDSHQGYGMPIGGVLATKGVVIPNAVGVDIGCGMAAKRTGVHIDLTHRKELQKTVDIIKELVPVGFNRHKIAEPEGHLPEMSEKYIGGDPENYIVGQQFPNAQYQVGTLGGGNHFIEIQVDTRGFIWIMIHSGSRNLGHKVATHYNNLAKKLNTRWASSIPPSWDLAFLPLESFEGRQYMEEMSYCVDFARANRRLMMQRSLEALKEGCGVGSVFLDDYIDISHNYARWENHYHQNVVVHRKGATSAKEGEIGIIPGSMGTHSYIVGGKGNPESFHSCSHGAGRQMGRNAAKRDLSLSDELSKLEGVIHDIRDESGLDEAPSAYKDIDVVMENQKDLVNILETLTPLAVVKG
jgi:tRNA-splicing ligase RtcB